MHDAVQAFAYGQWDIRTQTVFSAPLADASTHSCSRDLPEIGIDALFQSQVAERFAPQRAIFWEGDTASHLFQVLEGCLRLYRTTHDGRRAILGFVFPGDLLGLSHRERYSFTAEAVTPVRLRRLNHRRFQELMDEKPNLRPYLLAQICDELLSAQDHITCLGSTSAAERVATFLLDIAARNGSDAVTPFAIELPFRRLDIADYLGLTVETVSREISKLKRAGLISTTGPHNIVLRRLDSLREIARLYDDADTAHLQRSPGTTESPLESRRPAARAPKQQAVGATY